MPTRHLLSTPTATAPPPVPPTHILKAVAEGDTEAVSAWLDGSGRPDATWDAPDGSFRGYTLLMGASWNGHEALVATLLKRGASIDLLDSNGGSALMYATSQGQATIVRLLLKAGAQLGLRDVNGETALGLAERKGDAGLVREYLQGLLPRPIDLSRRQPSDQPHRRLVARVPPRANEHGEEEDDGGVCREQVLVVGQDERAGALRYQQADQPGGSRPQ